MIIYQHLPYSLAVLLSIRQILAKLGGNWLLCLRLYEVTSTMWSSHFDLVVAIAATRYCSGDEYIPKHIPVVIFVSCRVDSLTFARSLILPREEL